MKTEIINQPLLILAGPTAIGKTSLSLTLADRYDCEIISVDSMQVYRHMDIGTAKITAEERGGIAHHLIDIVNPDENYDAAMFSADSMRLILDICNRGKLPLLTGGTGLYFQALLRGIFPGAPADDKIRQELCERLAIEGNAKLHEELAAIDRVSADKIQVNDRQRLLRALEIFYISGIPWSEHLEKQRKQSPGRVFSNILQIGLRCDREHLYARINRRCKKMIDEGLEDEVRNLLTMGYNGSMKSLGSIGYRHMIGYLNGKWCFEEMLDILARDTRRYAKRQYTWFSKMVDLHWFQANETAKIIQFIDQWIDKR